MNLGGFSHGAARGAFETLEAGTLPASLMRKLRELARGEFLERAENAPAFAGDAAEANAG